METFLALGLDALFGPPDTGTVHQHAGRAFGPACGLLDLTEATCRWPVGEPDQADFAFCGAAPFKHYPYCVAHCLIAYRPESREDGRQAAAAAAPMPGRNAPRRSSQSTFRKHHGPRLAAALCRGLSARHPRSQHAAARRLSVADHALLAARRAAERRCAARRHRRPHRGAMAAHPRAGAGQVRGRLEAQAHRRRARPGRPGVPAAAPRRPQRRHQIRHRPRGPAGRGHHPGASGSQANACPPLERTRSGRAGASAATANQSQSQIRIFCCGAGRIPHALPLRTSPPINGRGRSSTPCSRAAAPPAVPNCRRLQPTPHPNPETGA